MFKTPITVASSLSRRVLRRETGKPPLFLFGFNDWKTFVQDWFPDRRVIFTPMNLWPVEFAIEWRWKLLADRRAEVLCWQYKGPPGLSEFCKRNRIPFQYVEDGFIRSVSLGAMRSSPISLTFDRQDMYFNAGVPTDLEDLLASYDFDKDHDLMQRSKSAIARVLNSGLSKYNAGISVDVEEIYGPKTRKRILVVGQVERDASIQFGSDKRYNNNDAVWIARRENPDAQIIYKPHPEVLAGTAEATSDPNAVRGIATVLDKNISLADSFRTIDQVYTITSLSGFEALLRGIKVTTLGCPFYSGWGLTDDRQANPRRTRKLTIEQIFAAAYILYPKYFDPVAKEYVDVETALNILQDMRSGMPAPGDIPAVTVNPVEELAAAIARHLRSNRVRI